MNSNSFKLIGEGYFELRHDGILIDSWTVKNTVVNDGKDAIATGSALTDFTNMRIGTGTTSPTVNDTELETEVKDAIASTSNPEANKIKFEKAFTFGSGEVYDISEAGLFDGAGTASVMLNRLTFSPRSVSNGSVLTVNLTITVA